MSKISLVSIQEQGASRHGLLAARMASSGPPAARLAIQPPDWLVLQFLKFVLAVKCKPSSSIPADYVSAGHVLVPADRDRIC
ncbi:hypothetical protein Tco_1452895 [Tanacetum coccineum]